MPADLASPILARAQIAGELATVRATSAELEDGLARIQAALLDASKRQSRLASEHEALTLRLAQLQATLPLADQIAVELAARRDALANTDAELNAAVLERAAWSAGVLTPPAFSKLKADLVAAASTEERIRLQRQKLALDIKGLESALARDRQDGIEAIEVEARATLDAVEARVARFKREVDELELLERLLTAEASAARASELKPVVDRLQEYARFVFPDARLELGDMLAVSGLARDGISLSHGRLSGGTSELIAILVRLAYARLLSDRGEALPLVLDDALVYADAERFGAMFNALEVAARYHQVIMLTCHAERIAALGARPTINTIPLGAWSPGETAFVG
jgi:DNA repair exonuclease SbcCD ATPase subunit